MPKSAQFTLLAKDGQWLTETLDSIYALVAKYRTISVLCADQDKLQQLDEMLWQNAREQFVTFKLQNNQNNSREAVLLCNQFDNQVRRPALVNLGYPLTDEQLVFNHIEAIVLTDDETVDNARRQYKMYRNAGYQIEHIQK